MSATESLIMQFEDMCGESDTEMGIAARNEILDLRKAIAGLLIIIEAHTSEYTQYAYLETIGYARHILEKTK